MSHTKRIYNEKKIKKAQRVNIDEGEIPMRGGIPFTRKSQICMGNCPWCRNTHNNPRTTRKRIKEAARHMIRMELTGADIQISRSEIYGEGYFGQTG